jgi:hypothetical protein
MSEDKEIYPPNIYEFIEQIKAELDNIENTLKNEDFDIKTRTQIETLIEVMVGVIYKINVILTAYYGGDEE